VSKKLIRLGEQFLIVSGLQLCVLNYMKTAIVPSFFVVWLLILAWEGNTEVALVMAFVTGIIYDIMSRNLLGTTSVLFLTLVYANCFLKPGSLAGRFVGIFFFSALYFLVFLFEYGQGFMWGGLAILKYSLLFALYNSLVYGVIELGMIKLRWKRKDYLLG